LVIILFIELIVGATVINRTLKKSKRNKREKEHAEKKRQERVINYPEETDVPRLPKDSAKQV